MAGLREMARVTRPGGVVAASAWDQGSGRAPFSPYWRAVREFDSGARDESARVGVHEGELPELLRAAGLHDVVAAAHPVAVAHDTFEEWWEPFTLGVGPAGAYLQGLPGEQRDRIRERCRELMGPPPIAMTAVAWGAAGRV